MTDHGSVISGAALVEEAVVDCFKFHDADKSGSNSERSSLPTRNRQGSLQRMIEKTRSRISTLRSIPFTP
ncbi:unnamed protein product [Protopolystoma xenopodis]|uniref:Uncharacterized protein n=1 Tax=Protopolystoma xenopodis TaxID=117903 RepID=A0A448WWK0_9PLAT|nr:unnamed protein product [Protopolystoma xenopodis]